MITMVAKMPNIHSKYIKWIATLMRNSMQENALASSAKNDRFSIAIRSAVASAKHRLGRRAMRPVGGGGAGGTGIAMVLQN